MRRSRSHSPMLSGRLRSWILLLGGSDDRVSERLLSYIGVLTSMSITSEYPLDRSINYRQ